MSTGYEKHLLKEIEELEKCVSISDNTILKLNTEIKKLREDNENYRKRFMEQHAEVVRLGSVLEELKLKDGKL